MISDRGVEQIANHRGIKYLYLWNTMITDRSVEDIARMKQLRLLSVAYTGISRTGFDELTASLPGSLILHEEFGTVFRGNTGATAESLWLK